MAAAELNGRYEGLVPLIPIELPHGQIEAILDTGFDGGLMLPQDEFDILGPGTPFREKVTAATGKTEACFGKRVGLPWLGRQLKVNVLCSPAPFALAGMELLKDAETYLRPADGVLSIRRRPSREAPPPPPTPPCTP